MDPSHFITLRDKLLHGKVFSAVFEYFLDHIAETPGFEGACHRTRSELLEGMVDGFAAQTLGHKPDRPVVLLRYGPAHFLHGSCFVAGRMVAVLYFEDLMKGLFGVIDPTGRRPSQYARFTAKPAGPTTDPTRN